MGDNEAPSFRLLFQICPGEQIISVTPTGSLNLLRIVTNQRVVLVKEA